MRVDPAYPILTESYHAYNSNFHVKRAEWTVNELLDAVQRTAYSNNRILIKLIKGIVLQII